MAWGTSGSHVVDTATDQAVTRRGWQAPAPVAVTPPALGSCGIAVPRREPSGGQSEKCGSSSSKQAASVATMPSPSISVALAGARVGRSRTAHESPAAHRRPHLGTAPDTRLGGIAN